MARIDTAKTIKQGENILNQRYDMGHDTVMYIKNNSTSFFDLIVKGFYFGYAQGVKATKAEMRRKKL